MGAITTILMYWLLEAYKFSGLLIKGCYKRMLAAIVAQYDLLDGIIENARKGQLIGGGAWHVILFPVGQKRTPHVCNHICNSINTTLTQQGTL